MQNFSSDLECMESEFIGKRIKSKYEIESFLGKGSMGRVYLCRHLKLGNRWAMKIMPKQNYSNFHKKEAEILEKLNHPNIPHIIDLFEDKEYIYIVETYIQGNSLSKIIEMEGKIEEELVIEYFMQLSELLQYLHSQKPYPIIYRDLKPNNIIVSHHNRLVLIDFSIAKEDIGDTTQKTIVAGNRNYSSPEQLSFDEVSDSRSDIYSLGMLIIRMLVGRAQGEVKAQIDEYIEISPELKEVLEKCTYDDPDMRYQSATEIINDLKYIKDMKTKIAPNGRKMVLVDGASSVGKTFLTTQLAHIFGVNKVKVAILDFSYDLGICEYFKVEQEENMLQASEEKTLDKIRKKAYKVGKYIDIYKGDILNEEKLIEFMTKLTKAYNVILIDSENKNFKNVENYVNDILFVTKQDEKSQCMTNKKLIDYLDKNLLLNQILVVVNQYERNGISKYEMLRSLNIVPKLFKTKQQFKIIMSLKEIERKKYLSATKKKKPIFFEDTEFQDEIYNLANYIYRMDLRDARGKQKKIGLF